jgi:membrane-bound serine protease (ClpP class)
VVVLEATGPVVPPLAGYIARGLAEADMRNAEAVVLVLDTPGGSLGVTNGIVQDIQNSDVPVIVYVGPRGALAGSAGLLITLAGHAAAMAPGTAIGASSPVDATGGDLPSTIAQKEKEFLSAQARSLAERRGDAAMQIASDAVTEARAVSASEALDAGLIDFVANDVSEVLTQADGLTVDVNGRTRTLHTANAHGTSIAMSRLENLLMLLTNPNIVSILLSVGVLAIIVEIRTPGGWVSGAFGVTAVGLALYGLGALPVNWLGIIFIIMAFVLFFLELHATTHGALAFAGAISLAAGTIVLFSQPEMAPFGRISIPLVIGQSVFIAAIFAFLLTFALRAQRLQPTTGYEGLVGQTGRVTQTLDPVGMVQVWGERWKAESVDGEHIPAGREVEVVEAGKMRLKVRPVQR